MTCDSFISAMRRYALARLRHATWFAGTTAFFVALIIIFAQPSLAQDAGDVEFEADSVTVDRDNGVLTATGNVEITRGVEKLTAEKVIYNQDTDVAQAIGNVIYKTADGLEHRSDEMVLDENFTHAIAKPVISQLSDGTRFSASNADHKAEKRTVFNRSRFSPCKCDYDKGESPIWDLRASSTTHNLETSTITHNNVRMHIYGLPVFYLPALAHPDWTVKRRSGVLTPTFAYSNDKGLTSRIPYYQVISPTQDIEFQPTNFQFRGQGLKTIYRQRWDRSELDLRVIAGKLETFKQTREQVGAIELDYSARVGSGWKVNSKLKRSSQDTFLRRYGYDSSLSQISSFTANKMDDNRYYLIEASDFQGLRSGDTPDKEPTILPHIYYEKTRAGFNDNQELKTEFSLLQLDNDDSHEMVRWTALQSLLHKHAFLGGVTSYQVDGLATYHDIQNTDDTASGLKQFGGVNLIASVGWHRFLPTQIGSTPAIVTPKVKFTAIEGSDRTDEVPNRDAADFRLDEANMFLNNRFQGRDYILPGSRADAGLSLATDLPVLGSLSSFVGVSYTASGQKTAGLTATSSKYSDYIASLDISTPYNVGINWAGRADSEDMRIQESRTSISYNRGGTNISFGHTQISNLYFASGNTDREEASVSASQKITKSLTLKANQVWNLSDNQRKKEQSTFSAVWTGGFQDCLTLSLDYKRDPFADRDVKKVSELQLFVTFKYLGTISQSDISGN